MSSDVDRRTRVSALILAGGRARRMGGIDKRQLVIEGRTIFERQCDVLAPRVAELVVSSRSPVSAPAHVNIAVRTVADAIDDGGPLAGIAAGLAAARTEWMLVVAGDMPYISGALVDRMIDRMSDRTHRSASSERCAPVDGSALRDRIDRSTADVAIDAVALRVGALPEPLCSLLRVAACQPAVAARVAARALKASRLFTDDNLAIEWIEEPELREIDPTLRMLANVNEPADL